MVSSINHASLRDLLLLFLLLLLLLLLLQLMVIIIGDAVENTVYFIFFDSNMLLYIVIRHLISISIVAVVSVSLFIVRGSANPIWPICKVIYTLLFCHFMVYYIERYWLQKFWNFFFGLEKSYILLYIVLVITSTTSL